MRTLVSRLRPEQMRLLFLIVLMVLMVILFSIQIPGYFNASFVNRRLDECGRGRRVGPSHRR